VLPRDPLAASDVPRDWTAATPAAVAA
jgi:hypothetical protein